MRALALAVLLALALGGAAVVASTYSQRTYCGCEERPNGYGGSAWWSGYVLGLEGCREVAGRPMWCDAASTCEGRGTGFYDCR